jgi:hypothetical protein
VDQLKQEHHHHQQQHQAVILVHQLRQQKHPLQLLTKDKVAQEQQQQEQQQQPVNRPHQEQQRCQLLLKLHLEVVQLMQQAWLELKAKKFLQQSQQQAPRLIKCELQPQLEQKT